MYMYGLNFSWKNKDLGEAFVYKFSESECIAHGCIRERDYPKIKTLFIRDDVPINTITSPGRYLYNSFYNIKNVHLPSINYMKGIESFILSKDVFKLNIFVDGELLKGLIYDSNKSMLIRCLDPNIESIDIPDSVRIIGSNAFAFCKKLKKVNMPDKLGTIGDGAFHNCNSLDNVDIPDSVTSLGEEAFCKCLNLKHIKLSKNIKGISFFTFSWCSQLREITIPEGVESLSYGVFYDCTNLRKIELPESLNVLDMDVFNGCKKLETLRIPKNIKKFGVPNLDGCYNLKSIDIENPDLKFYYCPFTSFPSSMIFFYKKIHIENFSENSIRDFLKVIFNEYFSFSDFAFIFKGKYIWDYIYDFVRNQNYENTTCRLIKFMKENKLINKCNFNSILKLSTLYNKADIISGLLEYKVEEGLELDMQKSLEKDLDKALGLS